MSLRRGTIGTGTAGLPVYHCMYNLTDYTEMIETEQYTRMAAKSYAYCEPPGSLSNIQRTKYLFSGGAARGPGSPVRVLSSGGAA